jgi:hypothetical protein
MSKIELTLAQAKELQRELFGFRSETGETVAKGLLAQDLRAITKFKMMQLGKQIQEKDAAAEEQRKALIEKYGTDSTSEDGQTFKTVVRLKKDKEGNDTNEFTEEFINFIKEYEELLLVKTVFEADKLRMTDLEFKTDEVYPFVFEYLVETADVTPLVKLD